MLMASYQGPPTPAEHSSSISSKQLQSQTYAQDDIIMPGFGIEFEHSLKRAWEDREDGERGRLARYSRFGMTVEEAGRTTPEHMRQAYETLVKAQLADVYIPSPSPSPSPSPLSAAISPHIKENSVTDILDLSSYKNRDRTSQSTTTIKPITKSSSIARPIRLKTTIDYASKSPVSRITKRPRTNWRVPQRLPSRTIHRSSHRMETRSGKLARMGRLV